MRSDKLLFALRTEGQAFSLCGPSCWGQAPSLSHREAVSALILMGKLCTSWPQAEMFASHRCQLRGGGGSLVHVVCSVWWGPNTLPAGRANSHLPPAKTVAFIQESCMLPTSCLGKKQTNKQPPLQNPTRFRGSPRNRDKDFTLASIHAFPRVYPCCKITHRAQDSVNGSQPW